MAKMIRVVPRWSSSWHHHGRGARIRTGIFRGDLDRRVRTRVGIIQIMVVDMFELYNIVSWESKRMITMAIHESSFFKNLPLWEVYRTWDIIAFSRCFWELCPRRALLIWCLKSWEWSKRFRRCQRRSNNQNQYQRGASRCQIESSGIEKLDAQFNINISMIWIDSRLVHDWDSTILMWQR